MTWWDIQQDYDATRLESSNFAIALTESLEGYVAATLTDAANAAVSAAALVENAGGVQAFRNERRLHDELKRELPDQRSTARLLVADAGGHVIASSAEYPLAPRLSIADDAGTRWLSSHPGRMLHLGNPQHSSIDGEYVLPYVCAIRDRQGALVATMRAELRIRPFLDTYRSIPSLANGAVLVLSNDGMTLMRAPFVEDFLGHRGPGMAQFLQDAVAREPRHLRIHPAARRRRALLLLAADEATATDPGSRAQQGHGPRPLEAAGDASHRRGRRGMRRDGAPDGGPDLLPAPAQSSDADLRDLERRYWSAMEHSTIGMAVASLDGQWQHVNAALVRMFGYSREELIAFPYGSLSAPAFHDPAMAALRDLHSGRVPIFDRETCVVHKDGHPVWVSIHVSRLEDRRADRSTCCSTSATSPSTRRHSRPSRN